MSEGPALDRDRGPETQGLDEEAISALISSSLMEIADKRLDNISAVAASLLQLSELERTTGQSNSSSTSWWTDIPYPGSGYTQLSIILLAFFITCIMILIVVGNLLVCIAISTEKSLKTVQNWFIASLAVSDLLLGCVIMPFSLAYELMGYWIFGTVWCEVRLSIRPSVLFLPTDSLPLFPLPLLLMTSHVTHRHTYSGPSRAGRLFLHGVHQQLVSHQLRSLLVCDSGRRVLEEADACPCHVYDRLCLGLLGPRVFAATFGVEGT